MTLFQKPLAEMEWGSACKEPMDTSAPHTLAAIANMAPTVSNKISMAEIVALVFLAQRIVADPKYDHHKIIPVSANRYLNSDFAFY